MPNLPFYPKILLHFKALAMVTILLAMFVSKLKLGRFCLTLDRSVHFRYPFVSGTVELCFGNWCMLMLEGM